MIAEYPTLKSYRSHKTQSRTSLIEGTGLYAIENILKNEIVAVRSGHLIDSNQLKENADVIQGSEHQIEDDLYLAPLHPDEFKNIMCYINHSCNPNLGIKGNIIIVAMKDILPGEELCLDYAMVFNNQTSFTCHCGFKNCRGIVSGKDWMNKDLQNQYRYYFSTYLQQRII